MVTIRKTQATQIEKVETARRLHKSEIRKEFLARTEGKVWDEKTKQFVEQLVENMEDPTDE